MYTRPLRNRLGQTEAEFLAAYRPGSWPQPSVTVDLLVFSLECDTPELLMVRRGNHPWIGCRALPGGFVEPGEFTLNAARRELEEECHLTGLTLSDIGLFSGPDRDPRCWTMSHAFVAVIPRNQCAVCADDDADAADWFAVDWVREADALSLKLTCGDEVLTARVEVQTVEGVFGTEYHTGAFTADGIACDHSKMIASALLRLQQAGFFT